MTLSPKLGVVEISTLWHFRLPLLIQMFIKVASFPRLSGIGNPSPIHWSHLLKMQRIVLLSSLLWWELGTNSLITGPGEWLSFWHFTSKLSHTCEPLLMNMREIWFSFQGDWGLHQGDYLTAFLTRRFKLFSIKLERNFKKYMNYSTLCFKFTLKLTKISIIYTYIKTERFQCNQISSLY